MQWHVEERDKYTWIVDENGNTIGQVLSHVAGGDRETILRYARMMAAAPKLVKELRHFFSLPNWENRGPEWKDIKDGLQRLNAALAQVENGATDDRS